MPQASASSPLQAPAFRFGDNVDTDVIIPARYLDTTDPAELASHCMEPVRPGFASEVAGNGILVAGHNFGSGSSREHAPVALLGCGIRCVAAESLARIFYRNSINTGLPVVICPGVAAAAAEGDELSIDLGGGLLRNLTNGRELSFEPLPPFMMGILEAGGLIPYLVRRGLSFG